MHFGWLAPKFPLATALCPIGIRHAAIETVMFGLLLRRRRSHTRTALPDCSSTDRKSALRVVLEEAIPGKHTCFDRSRILAAPLDALRSRRRADRSSNTHLPTPAVHVPFRNSALSIVFGLGRRCLSIDSSGRLRSTTRRCRPGFAMCRAERRGISRRRTVSAVRIDEKASVHRRHADPMARSQKETAVDLRVTSARLSRVV